jgi:hypothetical protein
MRRLLFLVFFIAGMVCSVWGQNKSFTRSDALSRKNNFALTLGGNGLFLSIDYDRILWVHPSYFVDLSAGFGVAPWHAGGIIPHQFVFNLGRKSGFLMLGIGGTYEWHKTDASAYTETVYSYFLSPLAGWKKIFKSHLIFKVYASPLILISGVAVVNDNRVTPMAGISLGYTF